MHQKAAAKIALETLYDLARGERPRDNELAEAAFDYVLRELLFTEDYEQWKEGLLELPPPPPEDQIPF